MKIAIISHKTSNLIRSRGKLIETLIVRGHKVIAICNEDTNKDKVEELGATYRNATFDRTSINIFQNLKYLRTLDKILKEEQADAVLMYTIKPIIFGSIIAKKNNIKRIYSLITGMGYNYSSDKIRVKFIKLFCDYGYKKALKYNTKVIFQNKEDMDELIRKKYIKKEQAVLVDGSGVDMNIFKQKENILHDKFTFLMVSRIIDVKGVLEYCKAAEIIKRKYPNTRFIHLGENDNTYRGIKEKLIKKYKVNNIVEFKGRVKNVAEYMEKSNVVVLPSYLREGIPRVLQEALAVGRPIITTNTRGCKETIVNGKNGYLIEPKNVEQLIVAMEKMLHKTSEEIHSMSALSYKIATQRFDVEIINKKMIKILEENF